MNYILTQEELDALKNRSAVTMKEALTRVLDILVEEFPREAVLDGGGVIAVDPRMRLSDIRAWTNRTKERVNKLINAIEHTSSPHD